MEGKKIPGNKIRKSKTYEKRRLVNSKGQIEWTKITWKHCTTYQTILCKQMTEKEAEEIV